MSNFDPNKFANASADDGDFPKAPDPGNYTVVLEATSAYTNKKQNDVIRLDLRVISSEYGNAWAHHTWAEFLNFKTDLSYNFAKGTLEKLGMNLDGVASLADFNTRLAPLVGNWYLIEVEDKGQYRNVYFRDQVPTDGPVTVPGTDVPADVSDFQPAPATVAPSDDDIPF